MFNFLKKKKGEVPPDIGQEGDISGRIYTERLSEGQPKRDELLNQPEFKEVYASDGGRAGENKDNINVNNLELQKLNIRLDSVIQWIKQFYERFSYLSESLGEVRSMNLENEKKIAQSMSEANKVIDVVREVKPEELRLDYQRLDMKVSTFNEKIEANKQIMEEVLEEVKDIRRKSEVFVGTDALLKLNEDTKKDFVEMTKLNSKIKINADKSEQIFFELKKNFAESQRIAEIVRSLEEVYSELKKEFEKVRLEYEKIVKLSDLEDFRRRYENKLVLLEKSVVDIEELKRQNESLNELVETSLSVSRKNDEDIKNISLREGYSDVSGVSDYEAQMVEILNVLEALSKQINEIKAEIGMNSAKDEKIELSDKIKKLEKRKKIIQQKKEKCQREISPKNFGQNKIKSKKIRNLEEKIPDFLEESNRKNKFDKEVSRLKNKIKELSER